MIEIISGTQLQFVLFCKAIGKLTLLLFYALAPLNTHLYQLITSTKLKVHKQLSWILPFTSPVTHRNTIPWIPIRHVSCSGSFPSCRTLSAKSTYMLKLACEISVGTLFTLPSNGLVCVPQASNHWEGDTKDVPCAHVMANPTCRTGNYKSSPIKHFEKLRLLLLSQRKASCFWLGFRLLSSPVKD